MTEPTYTLTESQRQQLLDVTLSSASTASMLGTRLLNSLTPNSGEPIGYADKEVLNEFLTMPQRDMLVIVRTPDPEDGEQVPVYLAAAPSTKPAEWIAASERLPLEAGGEVLVRMRDRTCGIAWATYWHGSSNDFAQWTFRDPDMGGEVPTHWMPLPAAPQQGDRNA